jgi:CRISPR-associated protein Csd1
MILQALKSYYDRVAGYEGAKIAPPGYSYMNVSFGIILADDGAVLDVNDLRTTEGRTTRPLSMLVPQPPKRSGKKPPPAYLWDKTGYVFGVERSDNANEPIAENAAYREAFREYHKTLLASSNDKGLQVFLAFLDRWQPTQFAELRHAAEMLDSNVVFRISDERGYLHDRPAAQAIWAQANVAGAAASAMCLVTGQNLPISRLHASIKGVRDAQVGGASIVSFNQKSFESYGKEQGDNAPVSEAAAFAYTTALNDLLRRDGQQKVQIGDATTIFWADATDAKEAEVAESVFNWMNDPKPPEQRESAANAQLRREVMERIEQGRPLENPELNLAEGTRFYILGLSPNAARLSVRFWEATTLGALGKAFHDHFSDLRIEPKPWNAQLPAIWRLLYEVAPLRKLENVPPNLAGEMMRAVLSGRNYPTTLLGSVISRIRADHDIGGMRAAIIKACLVRPLRRAATLPKENYLVSLDRYNIHRGYRLGRLFAVLEAAQRSGVGQVNASVRDKFIATASSAPSRVFPLLLRGAQDHLSAARKKGRVGRAIRLEKEIGQIMDGLDAGMPFPASLQLTDQGHFFVGFYHQQSELFIPRLPGEAIADSDTDTTENS